MFQPTFVVEDALHLHRGPGVGNAEHGTGDQALQGRGAVRGPHQAPVGPVVAALQDLHRLAAPYRQLVAVAGHKVVDHHRQLAAPRELPREKEITIGNGELEGSDIDEWVRVCVCVCASPCRCPVCSVKCGTPEKWCLVGCFLRPGCPGPLCP